MHKFLTLFFCLIIVCIGQQAAYADKMNFNFIRGYGVSSVRLDTVAVSFIPDSSKLKLTTSNNGDSFIVTANASITKNSSDNSQTANSYNQKQANFVDPTTGFTQAKYLNFWFNSARLYINESLVSENFSLALNNQQNTGNNDWWVGAYDGTVVGKSLQLHTTEGDLYCLNSNTYNYSVVVTSGSCNNVQYHSNPQSSPQSTALEFVGGSGIESINYVYLGNHSDGTNYVLSLTGSQEGANYKLNINSLPADNSTDSASTFSATLNGQPYSMEETGAYSSTDEQPSMLQFWISGILYINGNRVYAPFLIGPYSYHKGYGYYLGNKDSYVDSDEYGLDVSAEDWNTYCIRTFYNPEGNGTNMVTVYQGYCSSYNF